MKAVPILLIVCSLCACSGAASTDPGSELPTAVDHFHLDLVWGRYSSAARYLPPGQRAEFLGRQEEIGDDLHFTEYEVDAIDLNPVTYEATVLVTLRWYQIPQYTIRETRVRELWTYDEETELWTLTERVDADAT
jgi:hypothetical protein